MDKPNLDDKILRAWQEYCQNPDSMWPCENFKAGYKRAIYDLEKEQALKIPNFFASNNTTKAIRELEKICKDWEENQNKK